MYGKELLIETDLLHMKVGFYSIDNNYTCFHPLFLLQSSLLFLQNHLFQFLSNFLLSVF